MHVWNCSSVMITLSGGGLPPNGVINLPRLSQVPLAKVRETPWKTAAQHMVFWLEIFVWVQQTVQIGILLPFKSATNENVARKYDYSLNLKKS